VPFAHIVQKLRREGHDLRFSSYSLASMAAQAGRFTRPVNQRDSVLSTCSYGIHLDTAALAGTLQRNAEAMGIRRIDADIADMERDESGTFTAALLADGTHIDGDLFVDCSGDEERVLRHCDDNGWESWEDWLPTDRFVTATIDADAAVAPYSLAQAFHAGWLQYVPTRKCASVTVFYRDGVASHAEAEDLLSQFAGVEVTSSESGASAFGRRSVFWRDNCIALGSAAVQIDPIGSTNLTLLQRAIASLLQLLPGEQRARAEADEFNRRMQTLYNRARDFAFLHYKLNGRNGETFWDGCREIAATDSLDYLVKLYRNLGRIVLCDEEPFDESCWVNLFDEHGITPRQGSRVADGMRPEVLADHLERMRAAMIDELRRMPLHSDYLAGTGGDA
jgi:tryptophan halogenase